MTVDVLHVYRNQNDTYIRNWTSKEDAHAWTVDVIWTEKRARKHVFPADKTIFLTYKKKTNPENGKDGEFSSPYQPNAARSVAEPKHVRENGFVTGTRPRQ